MADIYDLISAFNGMIDHASARYGINFKRINNNEDTQILEESLLCLTDVNVRPTTASAVNSERQPETFIIDYGLDGRHIDQMRQRIEARFGSGLIESPSYTDMQAGSKTLPTRWNIQHFIDQVIPAIEREIMPAIAADRIAALDYSRNGVGSSRVLGLPASHLPLPATVVEDLLQHPRDGVRLEGRHYFVSGGIGGNLYNREGKHIATARGLGGGSSASSVVEAINISPALSENTPARSDRRNSPRSLLAKAL